MEWLKKHWEILAAIAVGIPVLYWLYQAYSTSSANSAQAAQDATLQNAEQQATADYAQQVALSNLQGGYGGGGTGGGPIQSTQSTNSATTGVSTAPLPTPINSDPTGAPPPGQGYDPIGNTSATIPIGGNGAPTYPVGSPQNPAPVSVSSVLSTVFGSGGGNNDTAPVGVQATPVSTSGAIPEHGTAIAASPTTLELASLGMRGMR